ncbi:hypothetical protein [Paenibacillus gorillae]|uniref:hypothetical protein n=1 Tax=Paenibacillus gorillae TaxID=1243662 RepID=UPI0012DEC64F|nr:hypothetical protein [Paenibacillus gorillae]
MQICILILRSQSQPIAANRSQSQPIAANRSQSQPIATSHSLRKRVKDGINARCGRVGLLTINFRT